MIRKFVVILKALLNGIFVINFIMKKLMVYVIKWYLNRYKTNKWLFIIKRLVYLAKFFKKEKKQLNFMLYYVVKKYALPC